MSPEIVLAALLAAVVPACALQAARLLLRRDVRLERFVALQRTVRPEEPKSTPPKSTVELAGNRKILLVLVGASAAGLVVWTLSGLWQAALAACFLGFLAPRLWLAWQEAGQQKLLRLRLEAACEVISAAVRSGAGLPGALELALRSARPPLDGHLAQAVAELRLGRPAPEVVGHLARASGVSELDIVSQALVLQQQGMAVNLAVVFESVQESLRSRRYLDQMCASRTAENRLAAWVVLGVAYGTLGAVRWMAPSYLAPMFQNPAGITIFAFCLLFMLAGSVLVMRMTRLEQ